MKEQSPTFSRVRLQFNDSPVKGNNNGDQSSKTKYTVKKSQSRSTTLLSSLLDHMVSWFSEEKSVTSLMELAAPLKLYTSDDWNNHITFDDATYTRNNLLANKEVPTKVLRAILIGWKAGQCTNKHGHSGSCLVKVLSGQLEEIRFDPNDPNKVISSAILSPGMIAYIDDTIGLHTVKNIGSKPAVSLHLYYSPHKQSTESLKKSINKHWFFNNLGTVLRDVL